MCRRRWATAAEEEGGIATGIVAGGGGSDGLGAYRCGPVSSERHGLQAQAPARFVASSGAAMDSYPFPTLWSKYSNLS